VQKATLGKAQHPMASRRGKVMSGRPSVTSIACTADYIQSSSISNIPFCLKTTRIVTFTFDLLTPKQMAFQDSSRNICTSSLVISTALVIAILSEKKTDKQ